VSFLNLSVSQLILLLIFPFSFLKGALKIVKTNQIRFDSFYLPIILVMLIFLLHGSLVTFFSYDKLDSFKGLMKWAIGLGVFIFLKNDMRDKKKFYYYYSIYSKYMGYFVFVTFIAFLINIIELRAQGLRGLFNLHSNSLGQLACISVFLGFIRLINTSQKQRSFVPIILIVISSIIMILSFNKSAIILTLVGLPIIFLINRLYFPRGSKKIIKQLLIVFLSIIFLLVIFQYLIINYLPMRIDDLKTIIENPLVYKTISERFYLWDQSINYALKYPLTGVGYYNSIYFLINFSGMPMLHAHNIFFEVLINSGILGLINFSIMFAVFFKKSLHIMRINETERNIIFALMVNIIIYFILNIMSGSFSSQTHWFFWVPLGFIFSRYPAKKRICSIASV